MRELFREFAAVQLQRRDQTERDITLAWQVVRVYVQTQNDKRVPALTSLLPRAPGARDEQTYDEKRAALSLLSQMHGGQLITLERRA